MRGFRTLAVAPPKHPFLLTPTSSTAFSTSSGSRGRGRGFGPAPGAAPPSSFTLGKTQDDETPEESFPYSGIGRGHGRGLPSLPSSSSTLPSFSSVITPSAGRGRGQKLPSAIPQPEQIKSDVNSPVILRKPEVVEGSKPLLNQRLNISFEVPGVGRGKTTKTPVVESQPRPVVDNRHLRERRSSPIPRRGGMEGTRSRGRGGRGENLSGRGRGFGGDRGGRGGRGGRESYARGVGESYASGRRGGRGGRGATPQPKKRDEIKQEVKEIFLANIADGERLEEKLGKEEAEVFLKTLDEEINEVLPGPQEEAFKDACNLNYNYEFEPEYIVEFNKNPDIDEKPPIPLREALEKMKPFLMEYEGIKSQEEWEEIMKNVMAKGPSMKKIVDFYSGSDVVTAKKQQEELEKVAKSFPQGVPLAMKRFTDRALLSLQSNPGWRFDQKKKLMNRLAFDMSQIYQ